MAALLPSPELQFVDNNGAPYAGGFVYTYVANTSTLKTTWQDEGASIANTNPIVLDERGACVCWGDGAYRVILQDANGVQIFDQTSDTIVSAAMAPVVGAATLADARQAMGVTDAIQTETNRAVAAEGNLQTEITNEATTRASEDANLSAAITAETNRAEAAEANLQSQISGMSGTGMKSGSATTDGTGHITVVYSSPFTTSSDAIVCTAVNTIGTWVVVSGASAGGFMARTLSPDAGGDWSLGSCPFYWIATGH